MSRVSAVAAVSGAKKQLEPAPNPRATEPGLILADGDGVSFRGGDRLVAQWPDGELLYCQVTQKRHGGRLECLVLNGWWGITFNANREGATRGSPARKAKVVMKLPKRLIGAPDMDDWEVVLDKVKRQLDKHAARASAGAAAR